MKLTLDDLRYMVNECCKQVLNEAYLWDLYHHTTLSHLYSILQLDCIYRVDDDCYNPDSRMGTSFAVCLTRSKDSSYSKSSIDCIITLDGEKLSSSLRHNRIHPFNFNIGADGRSEMEERLYGNDIKPLSKYCKSIDIFVTDINDVDYDYCDDIEIAYEGLSSEGNNNPTDGDINKWYLRHIIKDFPMFAHLIHIHNK